MAEQIARLQLNQTCLAVTAANDAGANISKEIKAEMTFLRLGADPNFFPLESQKHVLPLIQAYHSTSYLLGI